ncbi:major facilitator superfamily domain-containing protein [Hyaloraphidium curvatum]|nr:major facilitator superfamily domain-containing protein [Hyaloraphidium curvatum]
MSEPETAPSSMAPQPSSESLEVPNEPVTAAAADGEPSAPLGDAEPREHSLSTAVDADESAPATIIEDIAEPVGLPQKADMESAAGAEAPKAAAAPGPMDFAEGGFYGWLGVAGSFFMHFIVIGAIYCWGVFQRFYIAHNTFPGATTTQLALVGAMSAFTGFLSGPIVGAISVKIGNRTTAALGSLFFCLVFIAASFANAYWAILVTQGILFGFAGMTTWIPAVAIPASWFNKKRGLAMGICVSGAGVGGLALGPLTQFLLETVDFRWTLRIWGLAGGFMCFLCSLTLRLRVNPPNQFDILKVFRRGQKQEVPASTASPAGGTPKKKPPMIDFSLFKVPKFNILFMAGVFAFFGLNIPFFFIPQYSTTVIGTTAATASVVLGVANGVSSAGRIVLGGVADRVGAQNVLITSSVVITIAIFAFWLPASAAGVGLLFVFAIVYGFFAGSFGPRNGCAS